MTLALSQRLDNLLLLIFADFLQYLNILWSTIYFLRLPHGYPVHTLWIKKSWKCHNYNIFYFYFMLLHFTCSRDMQNWHGHAVWIMACSMANTDIQMRRGHGHAALTWTCVWTLKCRMDMEIQLRQWHAAWRKGTYSIGMDIDRGTVMDIDTNMDQHYCCIGAWIMSVSCANFFRQQIS
jgi:hypothetical protein